MSDGMLSKKGKNFKEVIAEDQKKGKTKKAIMRTITGLSVSVLYSLFFLLSFVSIAAVCYFALAPTVFIWAGILVAAAVIGTLVASRMTKRLKNIQFRYKR
jgi:uncharacterized membrane protein YfcA